MDSMPDTWGRNLMKRRAAQLAKEVGRPVPVLYGIDFLLGVYDETRIGVLWFKPEMDGSCQDEKHGMPAPPWNR